MGGLGNSGMGGWLLHSAKKTTPKYQFQIFTFVCFHCCSFGSMGAILSAVMKLRSAVPAESITGERGDAVPLLLLLPGPRGARTGWVRVEEMGPGE